MASRENTFTPLLALLITSLTKLRLLSAVSEEHSRRSIKKSLKRLETWRKDPQSSKHSHMAYTGVSILAGNPWTEKPRYIRFHGTRETDERRFLLLEEANRRMHGQCLCLAFEAVEQYVKGVAGELFWLNRSVIRLDQDLKRVGGTLPQKGTPQYYKACVKSLSMQNCKKLLTLLLKYIPGFDMAAGDNYESFEYLEYFKAVGECRNLILHADGVVSENGGKKIALAKSLVKRSVLTDKDMILPTEEDLKDILMRLSEFGYLLYAVVSTSCSLDLNYPKVEF